VVGEGGLEPPCPIGHTDLNRAGGMPARGVNSRNMPLTCGNTRESFARVPAHPGLFQLVWCHDGVSAVAVARSRWPLPSPLPPRSHRPPLRICCGHAATSLRSCS
jgi:hypothetical protein